MANTLKLVETKKAETPYTWTFIFEFSSSHGGYGDRTGKVVTEVITPHRAVIRVERGKVSNAVLDNKWNMLTQQIVTIDTDEKQMISISSGDEFTIALDANPTTADI